MKTKNRESLVREDLVKEDDLNKFFNCQDLNLGLEDLALVNYVLVINEFMYIKNVRAAYSLGLSGLNLLRPVFYNLFVSRHPSWVI